MGVGRVPEAKRLRAVITGRVQGVAFRYFVCRCARELDLAGWVRNLADGGLEVVAEGDEAHLHKLVAELKQGPPMAWVQAVKVQWQAPEHDFAGFTIAPTAY